MKKNDNCFIRRWSKRIKAVNRLGGCCSNCGENNIFVLDFHHIKGQKENTISRLMDNRWSAIEAEIKKCILLCKNCHQAEHHTKTHKNKIKILKMHGEFECEKCGYNAHASCLDFHHTRGDKKFNIGKICIYKGFALPLEQVIEEIEKCDLLCKNCHAKEHADVIRFKKLEKEIINKISTYKEKQPKIQIEDVLPLYRKGMKLYEIANKMKCSKSTISEVFKRNGIKVKTNRKEYDIECQNCNKIFKVSGEFNKKRKYCSLKCKGLGERKLNIGKQELKSMLKNETYSAISRRHNVAVNTVKNLAIRYGLI